MSTAVLPDVDEQLAALDFEPRLVCGVPLGCEQTAAWYHRCRRCHRGLPMCEQHHREVLELFASQWGAVIACPACDAQVPMPRWEEIVEFFPLGGC